jgi:hypothetical protein
VDTYALERVEIRGERRHECLAFARHHFGNRAVVQHHPANQLDVVVPHRQVAASRFATGSEGLDKDVVERFAGRQTLPEFGRLRPQLRIRDALEMRLELVDGLYLGLQLLDIPGVG